MYYILLFFYSVTLCDIFILLLHRFLNKLVFYTVLSTVHLLCFFILLYFSGLLNWQYRMWWRRDYNAHKTWRNVFMVYGEWEEVLLLPLCSLSRLHFRIFYHPCFLVFTYDNSHFCVAPFYENNPCHFDTHEKCSNDKGFQEKIFSLFLFRNR